MKGADDTAPPSPADRLMRCLLTYKLLLGSVHGPLQWADDMVELLPRPLLVRTAVVYLEAWKMFAINIFSFIAVLYKQKKFLPRSRILVI
jgi:hypothetical protein